MRAPSAREAAQRRRNALSRFYITTAIDYVNGTPHIGHAYEKILADAIARFHRQRGDDTYFLTGTDEHGQKIARAAAEAGKDPRAFVDENAAAFKAAWERLDIVYDQFIRTTDPRHEHAVQGLLRRLYEARSPKTGKPVLFEKDYEGIYCEGCEAFKQEKDLDEEGRCPEHLKPPKKIKETNFFFRLSEYDDALLKHIENHPEFIEPSYRRNEVVNVIKDGLQDVSITRPTLAWGVALPDDIPGGKGHTVYVWADALLNYLSALGWPDRAYSLWWLARQNELGGPGAAKQDEFEELDGQGKPGAAWAGTGEPLYTNALHLIGKDISRFHCILWPSLLLAAGVPLPRQVYVHGFIYLRGEKLSKSTGNLLDPNEMVDRFGADAVRFYLTHAFPTGRDGEFTFQQFIDHCNTHLANDLGNLASRTVQMVHKYYDGKSPGDWAPDAFEDDEAKAALEALIESAQDAEIQVPRAYQDLRLDEALDHAWQPVVKANELIERAKPWVLAKDDARRAELGTTLSALLEVLRLVAIWAWPVTPSKSQELWTLLQLDGTPGECRGDDARPRFGDASLAGRKLGERKSLYPRIESNVGAT